MDTSPIKESLLISVIIPVWGDYIKYLPECLASVHNQTYKNYEIIVVDNKTDLPSARNEGIRKAKGEYFVCLDVDDILQDNYLEKTITKIGEGYDIVGTGFIRFGDEINSFIPSKDEITFADLVEQNQFHCSALIHKEVWENIGGYDESMINGYEDWDFNLRAAFNGYKIGIERDTHLMYRKHGYSLVNKATEKQKEIHLYMLSKI